MRTPVGTAHLQHQLLAVKHFEMDECNSLRIGSIHSTSSSCQVLPPGRLQQHYEVLLTVQEVARVLVPHICGIRLLPLQVAACGKADVWASSCIASNSPVNHTTAWVQSIVSHWYCC